MECDIAVIGAGPAGLSFARLLAGSGISVVLVERAPEAAIADPAFDGREIALTHRSQEILQEIEAWDRIPANEMAPLRHARVQDGASPFVLDFSPPGETPLGMLVPNHLIRRALHESVRETGCATLLAGVAVTAVETSPRHGRLTLADGQTIRAKLVVAADTRMSEARRQMGIATRMRDLGKSMLVARVAHEKPHGGVATEWFGHGQTVAMLPLNGDVSSIVLTLSAREIADLMAMTPEAFGADATRRTQDRWGAMRLVGTRHAYPLVTTYAMRFVGTRFALVGDAAVGMHPVTAHGFNFGLAGAARLAKEIRASLARGRDIADPGGLLRYERAHRIATAPLYAATNTIASLYTDDRAPARLLRGAVLRLGSALAPVRRMVTAQLMEATPAR
ncbi:FAD-dependent hydroxylase [Falsiroseomonas bella]|uniref:FAD-dependent hydroxylase n=1 Tax=Falsiroseomonas bella TaxID=2184016 RepID=A0A317FK27_9PROT|nr:5-demethoxyubiquinol-8 5-hydroxylase UbiM [Falsiroseomonas bella]PWS38309.1 FAD-dependent hydroxylase [Falsiroseomonas bella]